MVRFDRAGSAVLLLCAAAAGNAQQPSQVAEVSKCALIESPASRLICYDAMATKLGLVKGRSVEVVKPSAGTGKWRTRIDTSPIDDSRNVLILLEASDSIPSRFGKRVTPTLYIRCQEGRTTLYIDWENYLGLEETTVLLRVDSEKAYSRTWSLSTDNEATFHPGAPMAFIKKLSTSKKLLMQTTPYGESPVMANFELDGLAEAVKPVQQACKWS